MFGLGNIGLSGLILILVALLLVFGPSKLPDIGKGFGKALQEFRRATQGLSMEDEETSRDAAVNQQAFMQKAHKEHQGDKQG